MSEDDYPLLTLKELRAMLIDEAVEVPTEEWQFCLRSGSPISPAQEEKMLVNWVCRKMGSPHIFIRKKAPPVAPSEAVPPSPMPSNRHEPPAPMGSSQAPKTGPRLDSQKPDKRQSVEKGQGSITGFFTTPTAPPAPAKRQQGQGPGGEPQAKQPRVHSFFSPTAPSTGPSKPAPTGPSKPVPRSDFFKPRGPQASKGHDIGEELSQPDLASGEDVDAGAGDTSSEANPGNAVPMGSETAEVSWEECHYSTLGLTLDQMTCSQEDIRKAYHAAAMLHHPDKGGEDEKFRSIQEAYEVLKDPKLRQEYDAELLATLDKGEYHSKKNPESLPWLNALFRSRKVSYMRSVFIRDVKGSTPVQHRYSKQLTQVVGQYASYYSAYQTSKLMFQWLEEEFGSCKRLGKAHCTSTRRVALERYCNRAVKDYMADKDEIRTGRTLIPKKDAKTKFRNAGEVKPGPQRPHGSIEQRLVRTALLTCLLITFD